MYLDELETMTTRDEEIPTPKFALQRVHDILYVFGGWGDYLETADFFDCYSTRADRWTAIEEFGLTRGLKCQCAAAMGFDIHVIGGIEDDDRVLNSCRCFNAVTKTWRDVAPMHYRRYYHSVAVLGDVLYVMGGTDDEVIFKTAERYDSKTARWSSIAPMRVERKGASATALNGKIYIVGGKSYDGTLKSAEVYDPRTNLWALISDMRIERAYLSCVAFRGCVYAIGGATELSLFLSIYVSWRSGEKYDPETDTWSPIPDMSMERCDMATAVIDDKIFVFGGIDHNRSTNRVECFNDEENEWCEATAMSEARRRLCAVVVSGLPNVNDYIGRRNVGSGDDDENDD
jgi:kelch-like protein 10